MHRQTFLSRADLNFFHVPHGEIEIKLVLKEWDGKTKSSYTYKFQNRLAVNATIYTCVIWPA